VGTSFIKSNIYLQLISKFYNSQHLHRAIKVNVEGSDRFLCFGAYEATRVTDVDGSRLRYLGARWRNFPTEHFLSLAFSAHATRRLIPAGRSSDSLWPLINSGNFSCKNEFNEGFLAKPKHPPELRDQAIAHFASTQDAAADTAKRRTCSPTLSLPSKGTPLPRRGSSLYAAIMVPKCVTRASLTHSCSCRQVMSLFRCEL